MVNSEIAMSENTTDAHSVQKYLTFLLNEKMFAVSIMKVKEILEYGTVTPIPKMPDFISGAINLRGKIVPVVDLNQCLNGGKSEIGKRTCIVIVELNYADKSARVGITVDAVSKVLDLKKSDIQEAPSLGESLNTDYIEGMGSLGEQFVIVLNIEKIISIEQFNQIALQQ